MKPKAADLQNRSALRLLGWSMLGWSIAPAGYRVYVIQLVGKSKYNQGWKRTSHGVSCLPSRVLGCTAVVTCERGIRALALCVWCAIPCAAQVNNSDRLNGKSFEAVVSFAQSLAQWEFVIIGASILVLVGTSYNRPRPTLMRVLYLLFLPAWGCLAYSIYCGMRVQEAYLAYMLLPVTTIGGATSTLNKDIHAQISWMWIGLICFSIWLLAYLFWWILFKRAAEG